ncbi:hypothetical protein [Colwellia piezophila]|uniref:hypothetical protein n=1 Tax=Colwellia piezophila TaxID=211668 RepID=UPI0003769CEB|nr:hypothetical protein [Colwellia piezophila]
MTTKKDLKSAAKPPDEKQVATSAKLLVKTKAFHQYFTLYFFAILLVIGGSLSSAFFLFSQQAKYSQTIIDEQVIPLQSQLLQQSYLIESNHLLKVMLPSLNVAELIPLQQELTLKSKKLSLLTSLNQTRYQQWFNHNNEAAELITGIVEDNQQNNALKNKALLQLDTILDAITIQLDKRNTGFEQAKLLTEGKNKLASIVTLMASLNLQTQQSSFLQLRTRLDDVFISNYSKKLANLQQGNQGIADIVRDFVHLKDHLFKSDFLERWQQQLVLLNSYHQQLSFQQQELSVMLAALIEHNKNSSAANNEYLTQNKPLIAENLLPITLLMLFSVTFIGVVTLLWLMWQRLKTTTNKNTHYIHQALAGKFDAVCIHEQQVLNRLAKETLVSAETEQLVKKISQRNITTAKEIDTLLSTKQTAPDSATDKASVIVAQPCLFTEKSVKVLQLMAIKQQVLLGANECTANLADKRDAPLAIKHDYIYQAYQQGRALVRRIAQLRYYQHLQGNNVVLTLVDANVFSLVQAVLFNQQSQLIEHENTISATFDEKILAEVNLDAELFSELVKVFIELLLTHQTKVTLVLTWQLIDKNTSQQKVRFSGQIQEADKRKQLPVDIINITDVDHEQNEGSGLARYFNTLLKYQHGDDLSAVLTEQGYQLSFTLPLTVTNAQSVRHYPAMSLPTHLPNIKHQASRLAENYLPMPIEVLLAVTSPDKYQDLQQLLQSMGLSVTYVVTELSQKIRWRSDRFTILLTELNTTAFTPFSVAVTSLDRRVLPRGVFSLNGTMSFTDKPEGFSLWHSGNLTADSDVKTLLSAMHPWLKKRVSEHCRRTKTCDAVSDNDGIIDNNEQVKLSLTAIENESIKPTDKKQSVSFNFKRYIQHQGSAELALFMLDDYTSNNEVLVAALTKALVDNNVKKVAAIIKALTVNSKILAADELLQLCHHWQELLAKQALGNNTKLQVKLLDKTQQAVKAISQYADQVV